MASNLQDRIIEAISCNGKELKVSTNDGKTLRLKAVTFSQLVKLVEEVDAKNIAQMRELKKQLNELVNNGAIIEIISEPTFYSLKDEFYNKIKSKTDIIGIEGFI